MLHLRTYVSQFVALRCDITGFLFYSSFCLSPTTGHFDATSVRTLRQRFQVFSIICGSFQGRCPRWGGARSNCGGSALAPDIGSTDLILMNDGRPTYFGLQGVFSMLDFTFESPKSTVTDP